MNPYITVLQIFDKAWHSNTGLPNLLMLNGMVWLNINSVIYIYYELLVLWYVAK